MKRATRGGYPGSDPLRTPTRPEGPGANVNPPALDEVEHGSEVSDATSSFALLVRVVREARDQAETAEVRAVLSGRLEAFLVARVEELEIENRRLRALTERPSLVVQNHGEPPTVLG